MNDDRRAARSFARPPRIRSGELPRVLVTGGAGFVGVNVAKRLLDDAVCVRVLDSLARPGSEHNIHWLGAHYAGQFDFVRGDLRDPEVVHEAIAGVEHVVHLGAQVSATASLSDPLDDFDTNVRGTLNVLEAMRCPEPVFGCARAGGRRYYVSDFAAFGAATGWQPRTRVADGLERLREWLESEEPGLGWRDPRSAGLPGHAYAQ